MSHKVFEYFFDPEDLEPFYSELGPSFAEGGANRRVARSRSQERVAKVARPQSAAAPTRPILPPASTSGPTERRESRRCKHWQEKQRTRLRARSAGRRS